MATERNNLGLDLLRRVARAGDADAQTDGQLLMRFVRHGDQTAFAALVRRHGPMVLGVCRRVLGNAADADDAFQATFLVLVRKAGVLAARPVLGDYLHGMAHRTALKARAAAARRRRKERTVARPALPAAEARNDWLPLLDAELARLPEKYRLPIVLCDLEGRPRREVAVRLGWAEGTGATRVARGRALLAKRMLRGATALAGGWPGLLGTAHAAVPVTMLNATVRAATAVVAGDGSGPTAAIMLTKGVLQSMLWHKIKLGVIVFLAALATAGFGGLTYRVAAGSGAPTSAPITQPAAGPQVFTAAELSPPKPPAAVIREIDLKDYTSGRPTGSPAKPTRINNRDELADAFPDKEWQARIAKQVDFNNEMLLFFTWTGSGDDRLSVAGKETSVDSLLLTEMLEEIRLLDIYGPDHPTVRVVQAANRGIEGNAGEVVDKAGSVAVFRYTPSGPRTRRASSAGHCAAEKPGLEG